MPMPMAFRDEPFQLTARLIGLLGVLEELLQPQHATTTVPHAQSNPPQFGTQVLFSTAKDPWLPQSFQPWGP